MQRSGTDLLVHDADLRAADVDLRTGFDAICDYASFPVRIEITDALRPTHLLRAYIAKP
jgi:hypothetical protein